MKSYKQILLGILIGTFLVFSMGAFYDKTRFTDSVVHYWGTDNDTSMGWDNTNSEFDITTTGEVRVTASAVSDGAYGMHITGAIAGATRSEGVSAYLAGALTGNIDGPCYNLGSWFDITAGTPVGATLSAIEAGIYVTTTPTLTDTTIYMLNLQYIGNASSLTKKAYMMRFNIQQSADDIDGWFKAANPESVAFVANSTHTSASTDKIGAITINIVGYGDCYLYVYSHAGQ